MAFTSALEGTLGSDICQHRATQLFSLREQCYKPGHFHSWRGDRCKRKEEGGSQRMGLMDIPNAITIQNGKTQ